jgi:hypothetical protein
MISNQAVKLNPQDQTAISIVAQMDALFQTEAVAREQGLSQQDRYPYRWRSPSRYSTRSSPGPRDRTKRITAESEDRAPSKRA